MKRLILISFLLIMASAAALLAQDAAQPQAQVQQETKKEVKQPASNGTTAFTLGEIVVRDRNIPNIEDASTTTDISGKDIENRGDKSLADTLQMVPGLTVSQHAKGFTGFQLRGQDHERVAILVDGIPILDPYYGGNNIDISSIPVSNVSHVVVNRGAASALYGALGATGSINIVSKQPEKLTAAAKVEYGQHQNYTINAEAGAPIGNFYAWVTASIQNSNGYEISEDLTYSKRLSWFNKLSSYQVYGKTLADITLPALSNYLNDDGIWNNTSYRKYNASARVGYNITDKMEVGVSTAWYSNEIEANTFQDNSLATYKSDTSSWSKPVDTPANKSNYAVTNKSSVFTNRAFYWPEDTRLTISPYFRAQWGDLSLRINTFFIRQHNELEGYFSQDRSNTWMFPGSTPYKGNTQSIYEETSFGFFILPTYKLTSWNTIALSLHFRSEIHDKYETALDSTSAFATTLGTGEIHVLEIRADYITLAIEDQMHFNTAMGAFNISLGISYDAQNLSTLRCFPEDGSNSLKDYTMAADDSTIWGTRDSFNPVIAAVYDPIADLLRLRTAFAMKTNFPSLTVYNDIGAQIVEDGEAGDTGLEPERIYSFNIGFELFFIDRAISFRTDYFYTRIKDKIESVYDPTRTFDVYTNIDGVTTQGVENTLETSFSRLFGIVDLRSSLSYIYSHARNDSVDFLTMGEEVEEVPSHQFIWQIALNFITKTSLTLWGSHTRNQVVYVMDSNPSGTTFNSDYYTTVELHNPFMLHAKVQQELPFNTYVYVMCKNILDDYDANPLNPGPGRMFYFGGGGRL